MRSKRFEPIQEIVANSATELSKSMVEAARRVAELERQLQQLQGYRDDYAKSPTDATGSMDAVRLQNYRSFLDRLGEAIRLHVIKLDSARADHEKRRQLWSEKRIEAESLGRAIDRFRRQELRDSDQREQREGDDAAMRISLTRSKPGDG
jgi:flagellar export protein FliJ